jgi:hypothetical protein
METKRLWIITAEILVESGDLPAAIPRALRTSSLGLTRRTGLSKGFQMFSSPINGKF